MHTSIQTHATLKMITSVPAGPVTLPQLPVPDEQGLPVPPTGLMELTYAGAIPPPLQSLLLPGL
jgi:hypothetical protein